MTARLVPDPEWIVLEWPVADIDPYFLEPGGSQYAALMTACTREVMRLGARVRWPLVSRVVDGVLRVSFSPAEREVPA